MESMSSRVARPRTLGLRAGLVLGLSLALLGVVAGTATGAVTPFQQVIVVNGPASPIPVAGTVNVGNTPANQNVTVTNLPATQPVSGTVNVGNLPAAEKASKVFTRFDPVLDAGDTGDYPFQGTINVSSLIVDNLGSDDSMRIALITAGGASVTLHTGDGFFSQDFTLPVPATGVKVFCYNVAFSCHVDLAVFGN